MNNQQTEKALEWASVSLEYERDRKATYEDVCGTGDLSEEERERVYHGMDNAISLLETIKKSLEKQLNNAWIPVSERLPDNQQRVIVKCKRCPTVIGWLVHGEWHTDFGCMYKNYEVIAWQPLPDPYREVEE